MQDTLKLFRLDAHFCDYLYVPCIIQRRLFQDGWGSHSSLENLHMPQPIPFEQIKVPDVKLIDKRHTIEGIFYSYKFTTTSEHRPIPTPVKTSFFELVLPHRYEKKSTPIFIHFPATGDHNNFLRKQFLARPLLREGVGSLIMQSPFYGIRKPSYQNGTQIRTVEDLMLLGILSIEEGRSLLKWLHSLKIGPLGVAGISRGGLIAAIVAAVTPLPLATVPFIPTHSGGATFAEGLIQLSCEWAELAKPLEYSRRFDSDCSKQRLFEILDQTNITNFPPPMRPDAAICLSAKKDGLVSPWSTEVFRQYWPGSEVRMINGGHVSAIFLRLGKLRQAVLDSLLKLEA